MQVAVIAPTKFLSKYCTTSIQMCYADVALEDKDYLDFYIERRKGGDTVLLEYSHLSPRKKTYAGYLAQAVKLVNPQYVVLPSIDFSSRRTILDSQSFYEVLSGMPFHPIHTVGVIQGANLDSIQLCYKKIFSISDVIGLPAGLETILSREELIKKLNIKKPVVYLEIYRSPFEEIPEYSKVLGICTSFPLRLAYNLRELGDCRPTPKPLDFGLKEEPVPSLALKNVEAYLDLVGCQ